MSPPTPCIAESTSNHFGYFYDDEGLGRLPTDQSDFLASQFNSKLPSQPQDHEHQTAELPLYPPQPPQGSAHEDTLSSCATSTFFPSKPIDEDSTPIANSQSMCTVQQEESQAMFSSNPTLDTTSTPKPTKDTCTAPGDDPMDLDLALALGKAISDDNQCHTPTSLMFCCVQEGKSNA